jgi:hypothetical protein
MKRLALLALTCAGAAAHYAYADDASALAVLRAGCSADAQKFCSNVAPGGGRIIACLKENKDALSDQCKQAAAKVSAMSGNGTRSGTPAAASDSGAATPAPPPSPPAAAAHHGPTTAAAALPGSYVLMKKVQLLDPGIAANGSQAAYDLLIPTSWDLKGAVTFGGGKGGCLSDLMAAHWEAASPDGSLIFQGAPNYSWQYSTDPAQLRKLNDPLRRQLGAGGKPCPVAKPMKAEEYFRQQVVPNLAAGTTVVSVQAFPELDQLVRQQSGLPANDSNTVRADAIRARFEFKKDGKPMEGWASLAVVTRAFPAGPGMFLNCSAVDFTAFAAPQGKLDANDKLYKLMLGSVRPLPKWQAYASSVIGKLSQAEAQKEAQQDQMVADFQRKVAQTIMAATANAARGANQAAFGEGQIIRGVQTFRDPATGKTMELSNQYDHAWLNGNDEYVMSDDPNFNPNGQLNGSWDQLQIVHPSP